MKKFLVAVVIVVAGLVITANAADAHVHEVSASCEDGVSVNLTKYADGNTVAVTIDDRTVLTGFEGEHSSNLSNPDKTVSHTWSVVVTSGDGVGAFTESGTIEACETPVTPPTTTTVPPTPKAPPVPPRAVVAPPRTAG